jgi:hypothetical protein
LGHKGIWMAVSWAFPLAGVNADNTRERSAVNRSSFIFLALWIEGTEDYAMQSVGCN